VSVVHYVFFEPPLVGATGCAKVVKYDANNAVVFEQRGTLSTNPAHVTCKRCAAFLAYWAGPAPRRLPESDEVPY